MSKSQRATRRRIRINALKAFRASAMRNSLVGCKAMAVIDALIQEAIRRA